MLSQGQGAYTHTACGLDVSLQPSGKWVRLCDSLEMLGMQRDVDDKQGHLGIGKLMERDENE